MITRNTIDTIMSSVRIEDVVGDFVSLRKRGSNLIGLCPFHNEKTPSFNVSPARGIYKCFGCGKAGNAVTFLMEHEQYSYPEALRHIADRYNIEIEEEEQSPEYTEEQRLRESLLVLTGFAAKYYQDQLHQTDEGRSVGEGYFYERGFTEKTIETFLLGYAPEGMHAFTTHALAEGFTIEMLEKAGLTIVNGERKTDRFHGRVIFPIHNISGKVIAFGARTLKTEAKTPKYLNSPETEIYHKSKILYGIWHSRKAISNKDECYLVEGYTDVISLFQSGIENVVASSGTALTPDQIRLIGRYTSNVTVLYDGDPAGIKASLRGIDLILSAGLNVRVVLFPDGHDPDSFAKSHNISELQKYLTENATDFIRFKTSLLLKEVAGDPIKKAGLIRNIMETIALVPDPIMRSTYTRDCSSLMEIDEQILVSELNKIIRKNITRTGPDVIEDVVEEIITEVTQEETVDDVLDFHEFDLLRLAFNYADRQVDFMLDTDEGQKTVTEPVWEFIVKEIRAESIEFENPVFSNMLTSLKLLFDKGNGFSADHFINHSDIDIQTHTATMLANKYTLSERWQDKGIYITTEAEQLSKAVMGSLYAWKNKVILRMIQDVREKLKETDDEHEQFELLRTQMGLDELKASISKKLGIVILK